jgi:hypothetical protein
VIVKLTALLLLFVTAASSQSAVYFDDGASDRMRVGNAAWELSLSKTNGAILDVFDRVLDTSLSTLSRNGCLWGASLDSAPGYLGGCSYNLTGANRFSYSWSAPDSTLTLTYAGQSTASVTLVASQQAYFDLQLEVVNHTGATVTRYLFPSDLLLKNTAVTAAYLPFYVPGVKLLPGFFSPGRNFTTTYPGSTFADLVAVDSNGSTLAYYAVNPGHTTQAADIGFHDDSQNTPGTFYLTHNLETWAPDGSSFASPMIRVWIGQPVGAVASGYRADNGIADYPTVSDKLGARFAALAKAPLVKLEMSSAASFSSMIPGLSLVTAPALLHPVSYWPRNFDQNYPDFLPPNAKLGTTEDFAAWTMAAQSLGLFVMPYTNPTWWDDQSPTVLSLPAPLTISNIAVQDRSGAAVYETYAPNRGLVASPYSAFVAQRIAGLMAQWSSAVPVDLVFQDQIGARPWRLDFNSAEPDPTQYSSGWLALTRVFAGQGLMTEAGWDRLAETEVGFTGSPLNTPTGADSVRWFTGSIANKSFGIGNWQPYPLAGWIFHDKVLTYMHDLEDATVTNNLDSLTWNLTFGNILSYRLEDYTRRPGWPQLVIALQRVFGPRYAGRLLDSFTYLASDVVTAQFADLSVAANWGASPYGLDGYQITAGGFLARTGDGAALAGVFNGQFNGAALSAGDHYVVTDRSGAVVNVRQPIGTDTALTIDLPADWDRSLAIQVTAVEAGGALLGSVDAQVVQWQVTFPYAGSVGGRAVDHYEISGTH